MVLDRACNKFEAFDRRAFDDLRHRNVYNFVAGFTARNGRIARIGMRRYCGRQCNGNSNRRGPK